MKKILMLGFIVMLVTAAVNATETRVLTMGDNNNIMIDDANVWLYPGRVNNYPNIGSGEFVGSGMQFFGVNWKFNEKNPWVLGTYFTNGGTDYPVSYPIKDSTWVNGAWSDTSYSNYLPANRRVDLLYGRKFGTTNFGFGLGYVNSSSSSEATSDQSEVKHSRYNFAFGLTPDQGKWDIALHIALGTWSVKDDSGNTVSEPDGYSDIALMGRFFVKYNQTITFVPHASINFGTHGEKYYTSDTTVFKSKLTALDLGCGMHYQPVTNVLAVLDFGFRSSKVTWDEKVNAAPVVTTKENITYVPYWKLGLEGDVFNWLDVRFGATSNWGSWKVEDQYKWNEASNETFVGLGFNWNRLHIDAHANPDLFLKGFNFVSGGTTDMNFRLSALYEMF